MARWHPAEVLLLIAGLPASSRYAARIQGYAGGRGWTDQDYLLFDLRNGVEALRVMYASQGKGKRPKFREWHDYPGRVAQKRRERAKRFAQLRSLAGDDGRAELR
ncbi:hypothetical protein [Corynebacterium heidelbergense]|uniref:Uncharacterized protein n=1 Tax=Corynebacterium heidelbergense TaxID=2055947 RepID=A0A364VCC8_9CORY|nr:hypothetical protein [Corynebacterium heidelbergense]RAV34258.1 hypothetical protein CWC39_04195 [Corynebacterium heidelbergense]WCZ36970.1 hypothetical protein CHEID_07185 [Corynebacterium heidelbergense]